MRKVMNIKGLDFDYDSETVPNYQDIISSWKNDYDYEVVDLGVSSKPDRNIYAIKVGDFSVNKPTIFIIGSHCGREFHSGIYLPVFMDMLDKPQNYDVDTAYFTRIKTKFNIICIPIHNPASWRYMDYTDDPTGGRANWNGVDLNRNYPYKWEEVNEGVIGWTYKGPNAGSEPETQLVMSIMSAYKPVMFIDVHTEGDTSLTNGYFHSNANMSKYRAMLTDDARRVYKLNTGVDVTESYYNGTNPDSPGQARPWAAQQTSITGDNVMSVIIEIGGGQDNQTISYNGMNLLYMFLRYADVYFSNKNLSL